ncbi:MAG: RNA methyltransferase [Candidatus Nanopelagicales bacterium]
MPVALIFDLSDPRLGDYFRLTDVALRTSFESEHGLYIAESAKVLRRALAAGHRPRSLLMSLEWRERMSDLIDEVEASFPGTPVFIGEVALVEEIAGFHVHRGVLASMHRPVLPSVDSLIAEGRQRLVVLDGIVDHTNIGAIFRSVAGLGADAVLLSGQCADPLYRRSVRVSMGAVFQIPWTRLPQWPSDLGELKARGFTIAAMALTAEAVTLEEFSRGAPERLAIVLGSEGDGLSQDSLAQADVIVRIPMAHGLDSLNVAAASAVAMWALR